MKEALREARKASRNGETPIGCVIVRTRLYDGTALQEPEIIARGRNRRNTDKCTLSHAEILAIRRASKKLGDWRLEGCTLYVTLEPCQMCAGALVQSRIERVVIGAMNPKAGSAGSIVNLLEEPDYVFSLRPAQCSGSWNTKDSSDYLDAILSCPNGVFERDGYGVKTSSNLGVADEGRIVAKPRSSDFATLKKLIANQSELFRSRGASVEEPAAFPAWRESEDCELVRIASETYREYFGREPRVVVTHGGLESSTIKDKHPGMEAISIGPTVLGAHTPDEKMDLRTLAEAKGYLFELVRRLSRP
jgi:tRNA(Arg) A34 adenosine deaminase TadA